MNVSSGFVDVKGGRIHYRVDGSQDAAVLVLSNSLGTNHSLWEPQLPAFASEFRVVRYDGRGHGKSSVSVDEYTIEVLAHDLIAVLDHLEIPTASFCGLSLGGMVGQWLGIYAPARVHKLALCSTAAKIGSLETWKSRIDAVRKDGMPAVTESILERWFTPQFSRRNPGAVQRIRQQLLTTAPDGYISNSAAVRDADFRTMLGSVRSQTLVLSASQDRSTPPADGKFLAENIPGAKYVELDAAHLANVEAAQQFTEKIVDFMTS